MKFLVLFVLLFCPGARSATFDCASLMVEISEQPRSASIHYLNLIRYLIRDRNALSESDLRQLLYRSEPINPMKLTEGKLSVEQQYAFNQAFEKLFSNGASILKKEWSQTQGEITLLLDGKKESESKRSKSQNETEKVVFPILKYETKNKNEKIVASFSIDEKQMHVIQDRIGRFYLVDVKTNGLTFLKDHYNGAYSSATAYKNKLGEVFLFLYSGGDEYSLLKIDDLETPRVIKDDIRIKNDLDLNSTESKFYQLISIRESASKLPVVVLSFFSLDMGKPTPPNGYVEINTEDNSKKIVLSVNNASNNGINGSRSLAISSDGILSHIQVKKNEILFKDPFSDSEIAAVFAPTNLQQELAILNEPLLIVEDKGRYFAEKKSFKSILAVTRQGIKTLPIPDGMLLNPVVQMIKMKTGKSFLIVGSDHWSFGTVSPLIIIDIDDWKINFVELKNNTGSSFKNAFETDDGNLDVVFYDNSEQVNRIDQVYGPVTTRAFK